MEQKTVLGRSFLLPFPAFFGRIEVSSNELMSLSGEEPDMGEKSEKKPKKLVLKRKHFIIALILVVAAVVITEGVLLVHTFSGRNRTKNGKVTPTIAVVPEGYQKVWKVTKETYYNGNEEVETTCSYEYDEAGRIKKCKQGIFEDVGSSDDLYSYWEWSYDKSGRKITIWILENGDIPAEENIYYMYFETIPLKERAETKLRNGVYIKNSMGIRCEYDEDGYWQSILAKYPKENSWFSPEEKYTFVYDSQKRIVGWNYVGMGNSDGKDHLKTEVKMEYEKNPEMITSTEWYYNRESGECELIRKCVFSGGKQVSQSELSGDGAFQSSWKMSWSEDGYKTKTWYDEDGKVKKVEDIYEIRYPVPSLVDFTDYTTIAFSCTSMDYYSEYFVKDNLGRVIQVVRKYDFDSFEEVRASAEYDEQGRIIFSKKSDYETYSYLYDRYGNLTEIDRKDPENGRILSREVFEYSEIIVPLVESEQ